MTKWWQQRHDYLFVSEQTLTANDDSICISKTRTGMDAGDKVQASEAAPNGTCKGSSPKWWKWA